MTYTAPHPGEPERSLTEAERLKARDLVSSMRQRLHEIGALLINTAASDLQPLEARLLEHEGFAEELQAVIWAAWEEDS